MVETADNINDNTFNSLSRNTPVALVVGAAGFLGSHLTDALLKHNIQVIGVDDFSTGKKENLSEATRNNKFHLIHTPASEFKFNLTRLDYIFFVAENLKHIQNILEIAKDFKSKIVLISSISLYDKNSIHSLAWLANLEAEIARFAKDNNLNARIVRLASIFGPRMHFREKDPIVSLIQASLADQLRSEPTSFDFSTRAIFIEDGINLIVKSMLAGSTAQKIFDGVSFQPVQVAEIKQILLDPIWYEHRGFKPTELPPWGTPNLKLTMAHLNWKPKVNLVEALRMTISYFKDNQIPVSKPIKASLEFDKNWWEEEKSRRLGEEVIKIDKKADIQEKDPKRKFKFRYGSLFSKNQILLAGGLMLIFYALTFPFFTLISGTITYRHSLDFAAENLLEGKYQKSLENLKQAQAGISLAKDWVDGVVVFQKLGIFTSEMGELDKVLANSIDLVPALEHLVLGSELLNRGFAATSKDSGTSSLETISEANSEFQHAQTMLSKQLLSFEGEKFKNIPTLNERINDLKEKIADFNESAKNGELSSKILGRSLRGKKSYLLVLQNNLILKPTGGKIVALAQIDIEEGKLKRIAVQDIEELDKLFKEKIEPPKEIKEDLGRNAYLISDSNWEPDFSVAAGQIKLLFKQITGKQIDGVITVDLEAFKDLLELTGPVEVEGFGKITAENFQEKAIKFDTKFLISLQKELLNRLFFGASGILPKTGDGLMKLFRSKHMMVNLFDPKLEPILESASLQSSFSSSNRPGNDFLAIVESSINEKKLSQDIIRNFKLQTNIGEKGEISHKLAINYMNRNLKEEYRARVRIYLPAGTSLKKITFGEVDLQNKLSTFSDYGRIGYSFSSSLQPGEQNNLILDYTSPIKVLQGNFALDVIKQPGTDKDNFEWEFNYQSKTKQKKTSLIEDLHFKEQLSN